MLTPEELRQIRRLHVQLGRRVDSPFTGEYRSAFRGRGMEFEEVRPYIPGDDVRHIDWNVTARANAPFIKEFREERELTLMLVVDVSPSMRFGTGGQDGRTDKRLQVARLAGALAFAAVRNNDRVGLVSFADDIERFLPNVSAHFLDEFDKQWRARAPDEVGPSVPCASARKRRPA